MLDSTQEKGHASKEPRRTFLKRLATLGLGLLAAACTSEEPTQKSDPPKTTATQPKPARKDSTPAPQPTDTIQERNIVVSRGGRAAGATVIVEKGGELITVSTWDELYNNPDGTRREWVAISRPEVADTYFNGVLPVSVENLLGMDPRMQIYRVTNYTILTDRRYPANSPEGVRDDWTQSLVIAIPEATEEREMAFTYLLRLDDDPEPLVPYFHAVINEGVAILDNR